MFRKIITSLVVMGLLSQPLIAQAKMIGTDQSIAITRDIESRDKVSEFLNRRDVAAKLASMGLTAAIANERAAAMTQEEINSIAGKIDSLPAGGFVISEGMGVLLILATVLIAILAFTRNEPAKAS